MAYVEKLTMANVMCFNLSVMLFTGTAVVSLALLYPYVDAMIMTAIFVAAWAGLGTFVGKVFVGFQLVAMSVSEEDMYAFEELA